MTGSASPCTSLAAPAATTAEARLTVCVCLCQYTCAVARQNFSSGRCIPEVLGLKWEAAAAAARALAAASDAAASTIATAAAAMGLKGITEAAGDASTRIAKKAFECFMSIGRVQVRVPVAVVSAEATGVGIAANGQLLVLA